MASTGSMTMTGLRAAVSLIALAATAQALPHKREAAPYTRDGCFVDNLNGQRLLDSTHYAADAMTVESCAAHCSGYKYFGLEFGRECYCADSHSGVAVDDSDCSFPCSGDSTEKCGANDRLDVYTNNLYSPRKPATLEAPYLGCFVDQGARALPDNLLGADDMTAQKCADHCANFSYFGIEFGRECWCANSPPKTPAAESECSFGCAGDDTQLCGAGNRINVWGAPLPSPETVGTHEYLGCFTDKRDQRSLRGPVTYDPAMTLEKCAAACGDYTYFGVEVGSQCYCGTILESSAEERPQAECSARCGGEYNSVCGDADRLNVYVSAACKEDPANVPSVAGFTYKSCWADNLAGRVLTGKELRSDSMTVETCADFCQGFQYFGLEYSRECYCGNELVGAAAPEDECSEICRGDATQWCGAPDRLNIYEAPAPTTTASPTITDAPELPTVTVTLPGDAPEVTTV
ncbi:WSC domain-containing protein [Chaetomidium leptoderma]|uniref:WSC domain-containing protein n=1 Tax=Chaetomidium leptoderma TaxID=669021 RepID=A0AAN6VDY5_9PEZI|nr:WSC domain-containing protein [Chaetomidium leptoderma]